MLGQDTLPPVHYQLKITLQDIDPPVWRRVLVPSEFTLLDLHYVIQVVMGWEECHLHELHDQTTEVSVPTPRPSTNQQTRARLGSSMSVAPRSKFVYQYDFGDSWEHVVLVEKSVEEAGIPGPTWSTEHVHARPKTAVGHGGMREASRIVRTRR